MAGVPEAEGKGESGERRDRKGRQGQEDALMTHGGTSSWVWHTASTQEKVVIPGVLETSFLSLGQ